MLERSRQVATTAGGAPNTAFGATFNRNLSSSHDDDIGTFAQSPFSLSTSLQGVSAIDRGFGPTPVTWSLDSLQGKIGALVSLGEARRGVMREQIQTPNGGATPSNIGTPSSRVVSEVGELHYAPAEILIGRLC